MLGICISSGNCSKSENKKERQGMLSKTNRDNPIFKKPWKWRIWRRGKRSSKESKSGEEGGRRNKKRLKLKSRMSINFYLSTIVKTQFSNKNRNSFKNVFSNHNKNLERKNLMRLDRTENLWALMISSITRRNIWVSYKPKRSKDMNNSNL